MGTVLSTESASYLLEKHAGRLIAEAEKSRPERNDFGELKPTDKLGRKPITANRNKFADVFLR